MKYGTEHALPYEGLQVRGLGAPFWRLYAATGASDLADGIGRAALPLAAASYTRDPVLVSGVLTFAFLPWLLLAMPSGALIDRVDRRRALAAANLARTAAVGAFSALVVAGAGSIGVLYAVAFLLGAAETVYDCAVRALLPQVVDRGQLDTANSLVTVEERLGQTFVGAPVGSVLFATAAALPFLLNAVGFGIAVAIVATLRGSYRPARSQPAGLRAEIADGVRWLRGHALFRSLTVISAATCFANAAVTGVLVLYVLEVLHLPSADFGLMLLAGGVGGVIGGLSTPPLARMLGRPLMLTGGATLSAVAITAMGVTDNGLLAAPLFALNSAGVMVWNVLTMSLRQALIPQALFGRVQGTYRTLVWGAIPLGALAGGALAHPLGVSGVFVAGGLAMLLLAAALGQVMYRHADEVADQKPAAVAVASWDPVTHD